MRSPERRLLVFLSVLLALALVVRLVSRGGPYFQRPRTIVDHLGTGSHETRLALLLLPKAARVIPRGATVTCFRPTDAGRQQYDSSSFLAAVGRLPHHRVLAPYAAGDDVRREDLVEYVIAVGAPFTHPAYNSIAEWPEGQVYRVQR
jgi:hypothetical protein